MRTRKLTLRAERLAELTADQLTAVAGAGGSVPNCGVPQWSDDAIYGICGELTYRCSLTCE
jgi:hypothetical protein